MCGGRIEVWKFFYIIFLISLSFSPALCCLILFSIDNMVIIQIFYSHQIHVDMFSDFILSRSLGRVSSSEFHLVSYWFDVSMRMKFWITKKKKYGKFPHGSMRWCHSIQLVVHRRHLVWCIVIILLIPRYSQVRHTMPSNVMWAMCCVSPVERNYMNWMLIQRQRERERKVCEKERNWSGTWLNVSIPNYIQFALWTQTRDIHHVIIVSFHFPKQHHPSSPSSSFLTRAQHEPERSMADNNNNNNNNTEHTDAWTGHQKILHHFIRRDNIMNRIHHISSFSFNSFRTLLTAISFLFLGVFFFSFFLSFLLVILSRHYSVFCDLASSRPLDTLTHKIPFEWMCHMYGILTGAYQHRKCLASSVSYVIPYDYRIITTTMSSSSSVSSPQHSHIHYITVHHSTYTQSFHFSSSCGIHCVCSCSFSDDHDNNDDENQIAISVYGKTHDVWCIWVCSFFFSLFQILLCSMRHRIINHRRHHHTNEG